MMQVSEIALTDNARGDTSFLILRSKRGASKCFSLSRELLLQLKKLIEKQTSKV